MNGLDFTHAYWKLCQSEHDELCCQLRALRERLDALHAAPRGGLGDLAAQLCTIRDHLAEHFTKEEQGGYMEEALSRAPRFGALAGELERQHPLLLDEVRALAALAPSVADADVPRFVARVREFCAALARHEGAETRIVQSAFNRDPIVGDT